MYLAACARPSAMPSFPRPAANRANNWISASRMLVVMTYVIHDTLRTVRSKKVSLGHPFVAPFRRKRGVSRFAEQIHTDFQG